MMKVVFHKQFACFKEKELLCINKSKKWYNKQNAFIIIILQKLFPILYRRNQLFYFYFYLPPIDHLPDNVLRNTLLRTLQAQALKQPDR